MTSNLIEIKKLKTYYQTSAGPIKAVDDISFDIHRGERVGLVGESGSGKSTTAMSILKLVQPPGVIMQGQVLFDGLDLLQLGEDEIRKIRGKRIGTCFQDPASFLNPVMKVGDQIAEVLMVHENIKHKEAKTRAIKAIEIVGIASPADRAESYPHQLSGGMKQRIQLAEAIACNPDLLIADEPTSDLDVLTQGEILSLLRSLTRRFNSSLLLVTHDLGIVAQLCDRVIVMYAGKIVEDADVMTIFNNPLHPYTIGLMKSVTRLGRGKNRLETMEGSIPNMLSPPTGCRFHPRCAFAIGKCAEIEPELKTEEPKHRVACLRVDDIKRAQQEIGT